MVFGLHNSAGHLNQRKVSLTKRIRDILKELNRHIQWDVIVVDFAAQFMLFKNTKIAVLMIAVLRQELEKMKIGVI